MSIFLGGTAAHDPFTQDERLFPERIGSKNKVEVMSRPVEVAADVIIVSPEVLAGIEIAVFGISLLEILEPLRNSTDPHEKQGVIVQNPAVPRCDLEDPPVSFLRFLDPTALGKGKGFVGMQSCVEGQKGRQPAVNGDRFLEATAEGLCVGKSPQAVNDGFEVTSLDGKDGKIAFYGIIEMTALFKNEPSKVGGSLV